MPGMALALCLLFDRRGERRVRQLWERLEEQGVGTLLTHTHGNHHPHLSLAVLREWDLDAVRSALPADGDPVEVAVQGSVVFPRGRMSLAGSVSTELVARQHELVERMRAAGADLHRHYEPGRWVPHVSVATSASADQLPVVVSAVSDMLPLTLVGERLALVDTATGQML